MGNKILNHSTIGHGNQSFLILHGLFGSSRNWYSIAQNFKNDYELHLLNQRNHGDSFWDNSHTIPDLSNDLKNWLHFYNIKSPILMGHSMGGLTVQDFALHNIDIPKAIIIIDIAPKSYRESNITEFKQEFEVLTTDISNFKNRTEIDLYLKNILPNNEIRNFLQTNIVTNEQNQYYWKINVEVLKNAKNRTFFDVDTKLKYTGPTLFIKGGLSNFITEDDYKKIYEYFPNALIKTIEQANHWPHYGESKNIFLNIITEFLTNIK